MILDVQKLFMQNKISVLSSKKIDKQFKKILRQENFNIYDYDFLSFSYLNKNKIFEKFDVNFKRDIFIFTSVNAILALVSMIKKNYSLSILYNIDVYCIDGKTSNLALDYWFNILATWKDSIDLSKNIIKHLSKNDIYSNNLIYLTSENHLKYMEDFLYDNGFLVNTINIYKKKLNSKKIDLDYDFILFFSPSTIDSFLEKNQLKINSIVVCIWKTTASYFLEKNLSNKLLISDDINIKSMFIKIKDYLSKK